MKKMILLLALLTISAAAFAQTAVVTECEWFTGTDPGVGNGNDIAIGTPENEESLAFSVATGSFTAGELLRVKIRCRVDSVRSGALNLWGPVTDAYLVLSPATGVARLVTSMSYQIDNGSFTNVDVADAGIANFADLVSTTGLTDGLHRVRVRATDDLGRVGLIHDGFLVISNTEDFEPRLVTQMEYRFDGDSFTNLDVADAGIVNLNELIATNALAIGLHSFDLRSIDDLGRVGQVHRAFLIVSSPFVGGVEHTLAAAEYFVNTDPGEGNGVPIPLPDDAVWDEGDEESTATITGLPVGLHLVGIRTQDDLGRWSKAVTDTILVGPILVINRSGSDIVLNWQSGPGVDHFDVFRGVRSDSTLTQINATPNTTYTDNGILTTTDKSFYQVTFTATELSTFRIPQEPSAAAQR
jgi:hypothetical protein